MTSRIWLIASREFRAYTMTASFWVALVIGPLLMGAGLLASAHGAAKPHDPPTSVLTLTTDATGAVAAEFSPGFPLTPAGRTRVLTTIQSDPAVHGVVRLATPKPEKKADPEAMRRFAMVMMLWMTLIGSLGMLLQAVVRERSNRALESLLAAAQPVEIVLGKLAGVGCVSLLVMASWLGASAALGVIAPQTGGAMASLLHGFTRPAMLAQGAAVYVLSFAFYGLTTIAVGALARDNSDAQNLARPMFAVLLAVFFTAMASAMGAHGLSWLVYLPPFAPFMLLMQPQAPGVALTALALLAAAAGLAGWGAVRALRLSPAGPRLARRTARA